MKLKVLALAAVIILALGMVGCGGQSGDSSSGASSGGSGASAAVQSAEPQDLILEETGYTVTEQGYVMYGFKLTNPNESYGAYYPVVQITGKTADGKIAFTDNQTMIAICPGESIYYGFQAGNGTAPDTVEFAAKVESRNWKQTDVTREGLYTIGNLSDNGENYGIRTFTGEITLEKEDDTALEPAITLILRDDSGNIVYGYSTFMMSELSVGTPTAFEIAAYGVPEFANFEVHATPWL